jgi:hypothetical protein
MRRHPPLNAPINADEPTLHHAIAAPRKYSLLSLPARRKNQPIPKEKQK